MTSEQTKARVLAWVNRERRRFGMASPLKQLPKGRTGSAIVCPVALAFRFARDRRKPYHETYPHACALGPYIYVTTSRDDRLWPLHVPKYVVDFMGAFDNGKYPELVA